MLHGCRIDAPSSRHLSQGGGGGRHPATPATPIDRALSASSPGLGAALSSQTPARTVRLQRSPHLSDRSGYQPKKENGHHLPSHFQKSRCFRLTATGDRTGAYSTTVDHESHPHWRWLRPSWFCEGLWTLEKGFTVQNTNRPQRLHSPCVFVFVFIVYFF